MIKTNGLRKRTMPVALINAYISEIEAFGDKLLFVYDGPSFQSDSIYYYQSGALNTFPGNPFAVNSLIADENELILCTYTDVQMFDQNFSSTNFIYQIEEKAPLFWGCVNSAGFYWMADQNHGLVKSHGFLVE